MTHELDREADIERLERMHIELTPEEWHLLGRSLLVGAELLPLADYIYDDKSMDKASKITQIYAGIAVLNRVRDSAFDTINIKEHSPNEMLDFILEEITETARRLYPYLNSEDVAALAKDREELSKQLNEHFASQGREDLLANERVAEVAKDDNEVIDEAIADLMNNTDVLIHNAFKEVTK